MKKLLKKYICLAFIMSFLVVMLGVSYNVEELNVSELIFKFVYAAEKNESSTKTAQSSTSTTKESETENSDDMLDLLARVINAEARGEPYLRSSSSRCSYHE